MASSIILLVTLFGSWAFAEPIEYISFPAYIVSYGNENANIRLNGREYSVPKAAVVEIQSGAVKTVKMTYKQYNELLKK